jgi:DNA repair protein RadC
MIPSVARLYLSDKFDDGIVLDTTQKRGAYILPRFIGKNKEQLYALLLDKKCKLLACVLLTEGSLDAVGVDVRAIAEAAIRVSATSVVLAHNHTHGFAIPSDADWSVTRHVSQTLKAISIELLDHIVVARDDFVSMADSGLLAIC